MQKGRGHNGTSDTDREFKEGTRTPRERSRLQPSSPKLNQTYDVISHEDKRPDMVSLFWGSRV